jgi:DNA (cytosine-5)-methyltransferase 1
MKEIILLDLFSGIGGFSKGISEAGFKIKTHYFSEIDNHAIANYKYNFPNAKYCGSVTVVRGSDLEQPNIITFGSPCQDFSLAGKRAGMDGQRSSLISEAIRLISECRPDFFIWENVKGAFSSNNSTDFYAIIQAFANIRGYRLEWQLLNTSWVLPQNRERIYLIGHLAEPGRDFRPVFPIREGDFLHYKSQASEEEIHKNSLCLTAKGVANNTGSFIKSGTLRTHQDGRGFRESKGDNCPTIIARARKDGSGQVVIQINPSKESNGKQPFQQNMVYSDYGLSPTLDSGSSQKNIQILTNTVKGYEDANEGDCINLSHLNSKTRRGRIGKQKSQTLDTQCNQGVLINDQRIRRLTEIECERLQGFPDNWTKFGDYNGTIKEVPKTQRYKMCGNSVTVAIVKMIAERLL